MPCEKKVARQVTVDGAQYVFIRDAGTAAGTAAMMVVARSVQIAEKLVRH
jgi:hypothetical protein